MQSLPLLSSIAWLVHSPSNRLTVGESGIFLYTMHVPVYYARARRLKSVNVYESFSILLQVGPSQSWPQEERATNEGNESKPIRLAPQKDASPIPPADSQIGKNQFCQQGCIYGLQWP